MSINPGPSVPVSYVAALVSVLVSLALAESPASAELDEIHSSAIESLSVDEAVELALTHNPRLAAASAQADALSHIPDQEGALPDPVVSLGALNLPVDTFNFDQEPMTQIQLGISQGIPFPGKRGLKRSAAEADAEAGQARVDEQRDVLVGSVRSAWWGLLYLDRALRIVDQNKDLMRDFIEIAEAKYTVGTGLQQDVLLAQLELSRLLDREIRLAGRRKTAQATLNALLDRRPDRQLEPDSSEINTRLPSLPPESTLLNFAVDSRNLLKVHRYQIAAADDRLELAERESYPDLRIGASYGFRQGEDPLRNTSRSDFASVMLSINVPLYFGSKQSKAIDQRGSERTQRKFALSDALRSIESDVSRSLATYESASEQVRLLESAIIPQAQQTVAAMLAAYQVNEVDFLNVINGQLTLYNAQINYWEALGEAKRALADLAAAVGRENLYE